MRRSHSDGDVRYGSMMGWCMKKRQIEKEKVRQPNPVAGDWDEENFSAQALPCT